MQNLTRSGCLRFLVWRWPSSQKPWGESGLECNEVLFGWQQLYCRWSSGRRGAQARLGELATLGANVRSRMREEQG